MGSCVVLVVCWGALSVSYPQLPPREVLTSRQDDENTRAPTLACVLAVCVWRCARVHVCWSWSCGVVLSDIRVLADWKCFDRMPTPDTLMKISAVLSSVL